MWIELHQSLVEHRKLDALLAQTGVQRPTAIGRLCMLWLWALSNRPDGDVSDMSPRRLGQVMDLPPARAAAFCQALVDCGFLDRQGASLRIHDWEEYTGRLLESRKRDRERKREKRRQQRESADCPPDGGETGAENPALPYLTVPNPTVPNQTVPKNSSDDGDAPARPARGETEEYLLGRGLLAEEWFFATPELLDKSRRLTDELFRAFTCRQPTRADYAKVFPLAVPAQRDDKGRITSRRWDEDRADLLRYAFEQANAKGESGSWPYIEGVLRKLAEREIKDLRGAEIYELRRDGLIE